MRYAMVVEGKVTNIIEMDKRNEQYFPSAVYIGGRPVNIGDAYTDGKFYRDGVGVLTELEEANKEIDSLTQQLGEAVETIYQADMETIG
mgnify:CR=1 FL=1